MGARIHRLEEIRDRRERRVRRPRRNPAEQIYGEYVRKGELAEHFAVSTSTVDRWAKNGKIKRYYIDRLPRFKIAEAERDLRDDS
jgi:transposase